MQLLQHFLQVYESILEPRHGRLFDNRHVCYAFHCGHCLSLETDISLISDSGQWPFPLQRVPPGFTPTFPTRSGLLTFYIYRRLDIKGVRDDLSGRARQADIDAGGSSRVSRMRRSAKSPLRAKGGGWDGEVRDGKTASSSTRGAATTGSASKASLFGRKPQSGASMEISPEAPTGVVGDDDSSTTVLAQLVTPRRDSNESNQRAGLVVQHSIIRTDGDPIILPTSGE